MDLIIYNGNIMTMTNDQPYVEAVGINGNQIKAVGNNEDVLKQKTVNTKLINIQGKTLLPGFNDSHMHLLHYAVVKRMIPLNDCRSIEELINQSRLYLQDHPGNQGWIKGRGWNQEKFVENRYLNRYDLDKISTDDPIYMTRACGHVMVVNSKAIEIANINRENNQPEGGHFDIDDRGEPTGIFREKAMDLIYKNIDAPNFEEIKHMIKEACESALKDGITSIQTDDLETFPDGDYNKIIKAFKELNKEGELPVRIYEQCLFQDIKELRKFIDEGYKTGCGDEFFKIGPLKLLADGSLGARTALLSQPYEDEPTTCGIGLFNQEELNEIVTLAHNKGMQIAIHCIGDETLRRAIMSFEKVLKELPRDDHRHGIVHCQITNNELTQRLRDNGLVAYIQPIFLDSDISIVEKRIGSERAKESYNYKTMIDLDIHTPYGSDCPVEPFNVMRSIYCAVTRQNLEGKPKGGWLPEQKVSLMDALYNYTKEGAFASFEENIKGSIEEGMLADLVLLDRDIDGISAESLKDVQVDMTIVNGDIKYKREL